MRATGLNLNTLYTAVKTHFNQGRDTYKPLWPEIATLIESNTAMETYAWLGEFSRLREWVGEREINRMEMHGYTLKNKKFEATEGIPSEYIEDDTYGILMPKFQDMGYAASTHPDEMLFALVAAGFTQLCYDNQFYFDTDHPVGEEGDKKSVSNMLAGSGVPWFVLDTSRPLKPFIYQRRKPYRLNDKTNADNSDHVFMLDEYLYGVDARGNWGYGFWQQAFAAKVDLTPDNYKKVRQAMRGFKSNKGRPLGVKPTVCLVGPTWESAAEEIFETPTLPGGGKNPLYGKVKVVVCPWLE
ncbi:Mu-like prophage major head subunit gpT family protein [Photobacterium sanguinicancri]|uniref:Mu-like prophage major head subunit gpT family protein n=1 Tax=Photobacterium sanguinicancri TaxID=875932 RepID=UPI0026E1DA85|nr:Mu-like prophage major head subunit gpT family protein [Photobacterium sanguinicancri]MDO6497330.1 Mu-like prophage major head subunit gpT family protein [Photobacterium sanguinicancri]